MSRIILRLFDLFLGLMAYLSGIILVFVMLSVCGDVVLRYFFNRPSSWVIEVSQYLLVYITFLGTAWVLKEDGHIIVDVVTVRLSPQTQAFLGIITSLMGAFVCLIIFWFGGVETLDHFQRGVRSPSILEFPKAPVIGIIPFGSLLLGLQFIRRTAKFIGTWRMFSQKVENQERTGGGN